MFTSENPVVADRISGGTVGRRVRIAGIPTSRSQRIDWSGIQELDIMTGHWIALPSDLVTPSLDGSNGIN